MTRYWKNGRATLKTKITWFVLCGVLVWIAGCAPLMKMRNKNNELKARDKFSCGEPLPPRIP